MKGLPQFLHIRLGQAVGVDEGGYQVFRAAPVKPADQIAGCPFVVFLPADQGGIDKIPLLLLGQSALDRKSVV